jgi:hypothetical protein
MTTRKIPLVSSALATVLACLSSYALAVPTVYSDRTTFEAAAGAFAVESFDSFLADTPFHTVPVAVGPFTISMTGTPSTDYNFIDLAPPNTPETDVNGTTNMRVFTNSNPGAPSDDLVLTFDQPIVAFGADFRSLNDEITRTQVLVGPDTIALPISADSGLLTFFGFTSATPFTTVIFQGLANDVYGIDNLTYSSVPEPGVLLMLGLGLAALGHARRRHAR